VRRSATWPRIRATTIIWPRETLRFTALFFYTGPRELIDERIAETLDLVGLADKADRPIKGFSGGERQRLGIAQAQINQPNLLIVDEPATSLDPMGRRDVLTVMERLRKHTTIFYSTHLLDDVQRVSDTVLLAGNGAVTYTLTLKGGHGAAQTRIASQPWVASVASALRNGATILKIGIIDEQTAEDQLLRLALADAQIRVIDDRHGTRNMRQCHLVGNDHPSRRYR
jgi:ABC-2 type transport system ATP-binding protein